MFLEESKTDKWHSYSRGDYPPFQAWIFMCRGSVHLAATSFHTIDLYLLKQQ